MYTCHPLFILLSCMFSFVQLRKAALSILNSIPSALYAQEFAPLSYFDVVMNLYSFHSHVLLLYIAWTFLLYWCLKVYM